MNNFVKRVISFMLCFTLVLATGIIAYAADDIPEYELELTPVEALTGKATTTTIKADEVEDATLEKVEELDAVLSITADGPGTVSIGSTAIGSTPHELETGDLIAFGGLTSTPDITYDEAGVYTITVLLTTDEGTPTTLATESFEITVTDPEPEPLPENSTYTLGFTIDSANVGEAKAGKFTVKTNVVGENGYANTKLSVTSANPGDSLPTIIDDETETDFIKEGFLFKDKDLDAETDYAEDIMATFPEKGKYNITMKLLDADDKEIESETFTVTVGEDIQEPIIKKPFISGYKDGTFRPGHSISRAEVATVIYRLALNEEFVPNAKEKIKAFNEEPTKPIFPDVADDHWAFEAIAFMKDNGYMNGFEDGTFRPENGMSRGDIAIVLAKIKEYEPTTTDSGFTDIKGHHAEGYINVLKQYQVISGYKDNTYRPNNLSTRAELISMINYALARGYKFTGDKKFSDVPTNFWCYSMIMNAANGYDGSKDTDDETR